MEARWRAVLGAAEALEQSGLLPDAADEYLRGEDVLDDGASCVPAVGGRGGG